MAQDTGLFIAVPEDIAPKILCEGYRVSRRGRVPTHPNRDGAIRAYRRFQRSRPPVLLQVACLPPAVKATPHKDGFKLETPHLPPYCLAQVNRAHSASSVSMMPSFQFQQPARTLSHRPSPPGPQVPGTTLADRKERLARRDNVQTLFHATSESNATNICRRKEFRHGTKGFLGPGIYFSRTPQNARRYCQCRQKPTVVVQCEVNLGRSNQVGQGYYTGQQLLAGGYDSYEEVGRDCYMLPDNASCQIDMDTLHINRLV
eukprot:TRINITY_DN7618_c0_g2_i1.p1 TRINITY_DN7618_c0_g2~~TRINITY_DN7618_c0_g2_i1.p1  ORF type:complete len:259 (-),score=14.62 TRINITY_DN7618_c0_g2_i1:201-977(-)